MIVFYEKLSIFIVDLNAPYLNLSLLGGWGFGPSVSY